LAYVPWLLAFGLVLGWAGEAQAQEIRLSVDEPEFREDGGAATVKVTAGYYASSSATATAEAPKALTVLLDVMAPFSYADGTTVLGGGLGNRFNIDLGSIQLAKKAKENSVNVVITPIKINHHNNAPAAGVTDPNYKATERIPNVDLKIYITGEAGSIDVVGKDAEDDDTTSPLDESLGALVTLIDTDKPTTAIRLSLDEKKASKEDEPVDVKVTGTLNGARVKSNALEFKLDVGAEVSGSARRDRDFDIDQTTIYPF
jgi:hypothetical protein